MLNGRCFWRFGASCSNIRHVIYFYVEIGVKGTGSYGGLDVWGNYKSGSNVAVGCLAEALLWRFSDF